MKKTLILFLCLFAWPSLAMDKPVDVSKDIGSLIKFKVEKFQLENGLTVLIHEDHSVPILSFHQWFRVGSKDENPGRTGLAHFFEHLMFKGTKKYDSDAFDKVINSNGGVNNAFTSLDYTGYYENLPSDKLELAIDIESDRMRNLIFNQKAIDSEREVVKEERRWRVDNSVMGFLSQKVFSTVFKVHPYRWPIIGYMRDLNAATMDDMKDFYKVHYAPNNAVVVIAGAIDTKEARQLVYKYYGGLEAQELPKKEYRPEPEQKAARVLNLTKEIQTPIFTVVYKAPKAGDKDAYTLDLASNILSNGNSSRLYQRLVYRSQLTNSISSYNYTPHHPGIFRVTGTMKPGKDMETALTAVYGELYKLRKTLVSEKELEKAKSQVMFGYVESLKTVSGKARAMAVNEILFGDYSHLFRELDMYQSVTREDIKDAATRYLMPHQRSTIRVRPKKQEGA